MTAVDASRSRSPARAAQPLRVAGLTDQELLRLAADESIALTPGELRTIFLGIGRDPTRTEAHAFAAAWSEHCSYKSSRDLLRALPTKSNDVIVPVGEDAGVLRIGTIDGVEYAVAVAHESHNHPSQVVPFEGAATGVGGILRDVLCMGAELVASADPLRFGVVRPGNHCAYVAAGVVDGIAAYGNAVGVPNIAGDLYFHESFNGNCLVNVVALGIVRSDRIVRSRVPEDGGGHDLILVGKATDASGFGGAAFASLLLERERSHADKSAVQVPDPFLKNVLMRATYTALSAAFEQGISFGLKDLGAGGIMGSSSELCSAGGFGASIDLDSVPQALQDLQPFVVACAETQERMLWAVPPHFSETVLSIYNERFTLPQIADNARAAVIGKVTHEKRYVLRSQGCIVCDLPIDVLTGGIRLRHDAAPAPAERQDTVTLPIDEPGRTLLDVLSHADVCSRRPLIEHYDSVVRGLTVIPSGYADAGVVLVRRGGRAGVALSVDSNPRYATISARLAAAHAVVEAARNVCAVGARPIGLTDCLNYGDPQDPVAYRQLVDGVQGLAEAANALQLGARGEALPYVSGNVSLYNGSDRSQSFASSAIVACIGRVDDIGRVVTMQFTAADNELFLLGSRSANLGGSVLAALRGVDAGALPEIDYGDAIASMRALLECIRLGAVVAAHDISDGGLGACVAEMCLGGEGNGQIGAELLAPHEWAPWLSRSAALFGEAGGFVVEVPRAEAARFESVCQAENAVRLPIGKTGGAAFVVRDVWEIALERLRAAWLAPLAELYA